ncbi:MAG TPA: DUF952 domain-containing protein [Afifellaceae bacterium]|nr:DUF952 domain-containing protein [Afifellaceae bacterium]
MGDLIFKICSRTFWREAQAAKRYTGAPVDVADGYIHLSTAAQVGKTAAKHFAGQNDLVLVAADAARLGRALKWEPSRDGDLFPHLYGDLPVAAVSWVRALPVGKDGRHVFPDLATGNAS